jgi:hypothetical protein
MRPDLRAWLLVLAATAAVAACTIHLALERYHALKSGWSWDLAYYNQWFWALTHGVDEISVRPIASYMNEGPSVWKTNYLAPLRYMIAPFYRFWPDPRFLLVVHATLFWLLLPASYGLVRFESGSRIAALAAIPLVLLTPLLWPLALNDFRELQLGVPFAIWAVHGVRARSIGLAALGVGGLLACRQEYALLVASLAIVPSRAGSRESIARRFGWAASLWFLGLGWLLVVFFGYLVAVSGWSTPAAYLAQFGGPRPRLGEWLWTALDFLAIGLGSWSIMSLATPSLAILIVPWVWGLAGGRWALPLVGTTEWHHVRYAAPLAAIGLAAGLVGGSRLWRLAGAFLDRPARWRLAMWVLAAAGQVAANGVMVHRFNQIPYPIGTAEAAEIWRFIAQITPEDGVIAHYDMTAPLSSRRLLSSYILKENQPRGFPFELDPAYRWVFMYPGDIDPDLLTLQGFTLVHRGPAVEIYRRADPG